MEEDTIMDYIKQLKQKNSVKIADESKTLSDNYIPKLFQNV